MSKPILASVIFICIGLLPGTAKANPFTGAYVCVPKIQPDRRTLEFSIRDAGVRCSAEEQWMKVVVKDKDTILLYPVGEPLGKRDQADFDKFKEFYGGKP